MKDLYSFPDFIREGSPDFLLHLLRLTGGDKQAIAVVSSDLCTLAATPAASRILGRGAFHSLPDILSEESCHLARDCLKNQAVLQQPDTIDGFFYLLTFYPLDDKLLLRFSPAEKDNEPSAGEFFYQNQIRKNLSNIYMVSEMLASESAQAAIERYRNMIRKNVLQIVRSQKHLEILSPFFTRDRLKLAADNMAGFIRNIGENVLSAMKEQNRRLTVSAPGSLLAVFDREALAVAVYNLLANSVCYTQGDISLTLFETTGYAQIRIADQGDGIPEEALAEWRNAPSHTDAPLSAVGRGFALAHKIALLHQGSLFMTRGESGFSVILSLPLSLSEQTKLVQQFPHYKLSDYRIEDVEFFSLL